MQDELPKELAVSELSKDFGGQGTRNEAANGEKSVLCVMAWGGG